MLQRRLDDLVAREGAERAREEREDTVLLLDDDREVRRRVEVCAAD